MAELRRPAVLPRGTRDNLTPPVRVVVHAPREAMALRVYRELSSHEIIVQNGRTIEHVVAALVEDPAPRPQVLVVDIDCLTPRAVFELHAIRERGWFGRMIGIGAVPPSLRRSLGIEQVLAPTAIDGRLRSAVAASDFTAPTRKLPIETATGPVLGTTRETVRLGAMRDRR